MNIGLVLSIIKLSIEVFQDERRDRFQKKFNKIEKEWQDEMALPDNQRSDLALDRLLFDAEQLAELIISEARKR